MTTNMTVSEIISVFQFLSASVKASIQPEVNEFNAIAAEIESEVARIQKLEWQHLVIDIEAKCSVYKLQEEVKEELNDTVVVEEELDDTVIVEEEIEDGVDIDWDAVQKEIDDMEIEEVEYTPGKAVKPIVNPLYYMEVEDVDIDQLEKDAYDIVFFERLGALVYGEV